MKLFRVFFLTAVLSACSCAKVFGIVGFYNYPFYAGDNLFGSSLNYSNNSLSFVIPTAPIGTTVTEWDPLTLQYLPASVFNGTSWSINYDLTPGKGALLHTSSLFTNTFVGTVLQGPGTNDVNPPIPPVRPPGYYLLGSDCPVPNRTFESIIGRAPRNGEFVTSFDELSQAYSTNRFQGGNWDNGDPVLLPGHAAFYNLVPVPEPGSLSLMITGGAAIALYGRRTSTRFMFTIRSGRKLS